MTQLKDQMSVFNGFSEKEVIELSSRAKIDKLQAGEILMKKDDPDQMAFVILDGKIRIIQGPKAHPKTIAVFSKGDWIEAVALAKTPLRMSSVIAAEPTRVMALDKTTVDSLNDKTQLSVYKRLAYLSAERIRLLKNSENNLLAKNIQLKEDIFNYRSPVKTDFHQSEMIKGIIKKVPRLPAFATTLSSQLFTRELVEQIKRDPALVAIVLKTINSAFYSFQKKISDIHHAVVLLGFEQIYQVVIAEGIRRTMPNTPKFKALHLHSEIISHIAFALSLESRHGHPAEMASLGLLHEIGRIVIQLLKDQNPRLASLVEVLDQARLGSLLLKEWNLPDVLWKSVEFQSYPEFASPHHIPEELRYNITLLYLSHLCYNLFQGKKEKELSATFLDEYLKLTNWQGLTLDEIAKGRLLPAMDKKKGN
ncbi:MAG: HDOD domain-containing protein [Deltaproteobacteria bacterium]|nr:HDOD domain-containing protein [Deltaproteobacteria bacterium]